MRFAVVVFACVLAAANAQFGQTNRGQYFPSQGSFGSQFGNNRYNNQQYNRYNPYNNYNRNQYYNQPTQATYSPFKPFATSTPFPRPSVTVSEASATVAPSITVSPVKPFVPVVTPSPVQVISRVVADARSADTVKYGNEINADGSYNYFYETNNGIAAQEQGTPRNFGGNPPVIADVAQGSFSWTSPEGQLIAITYTADENGYQASGDAIPKPPPVPEQILRSLEYIARNAPVNKN